MIMLFHYFSSLKVPFESEEQATVAWNSLRVDPEPKRGGSSKILKVEGQDLIVDFKCEEARTLRVAVNTFFDLLYLVIQTMDKFSLE